MMDESIKKCVLMCVRMKSNILSKLTYKFVMPLYFYHLSIRFSQVSKIFSWIMLAVNWRTGILWR